MGPMGVKWTIRVSSSLDEVMASLAGERETYALQDLKNGHYQFAKSSTWQPGFHTLGDYRQTEPLKALFFPAREFIGKWKDPSSRKPMPERIVFGVKNCDLSSLAIFDQVFLQGVCPDPYYAEARAKTILVSSDCNSQLDVCFCPAVGEQPYATKGFDINVASTPLGYIIESGTEPGERLLQSAQQYLEPAHEELLNSLKTQRAERYRELVELSQAHGLEPGTDFRTAIETTFESGLWSDFAEDCVECGACNFICCTCHCFLLADGMDADGTAARTKLWDACLYSGFAATAGGGNPRPLRAERLRNRFDKKFSYFPQVMDRYACDGCGRCTEACIANIDIRDVLRRAVDECDALHAHSSDHRAN
ncbi:MAG: 4Fe-4S dicluster domain-containing protein [Gammaproteobacteria bacterium]|nr:4Fe-4S dicluster domain-containing protein [Gammaproteobacteria bacterium]